MTKDEAEAIIRNEWELDYQLGKTTIKPPGLLNVLVKLGVVKLDDDTRGQDDITTADGATAVAWRMRWKAGGERDREWEMWTYRGQQPAPNPAMIIEPLCKQSDLDAALSREAVLKARIAELEHIADKAQT